MSSKSVSSSSWDFSSFCSFASKELAADLKKLLPFWEKYGMKILSTAIVIATALDSSNLLNFLEAAKDCIDIWQTDSFKENSADFTNNANGFELYLEKYGRKILKILIRLSTAYLPDFVDILAAVYDCIDIWQTDNFKEKPADIENNANELRTYFNKYGMKILKISIRMTTAFGKPMIASKLRVAEAVTDIWQT